MHLRTLLLVAALGTPVAALADGMPSPAVSYAPTWSGVYAGFQAGGVWGDTGWTFPFVESFNSAPGQNFATRPSGGLAGGQLGFNRQFGGIVVGGELAIVGTEMRETINGTGPLAGERFKTSVSDILTISGRAGVPLGASLLYGKAGYANALVDIGAASPITGVSGNESRRADGWTAGAGWEYRIGRSLVFGLEYDYVDLSAARLGGVTGGAAPGLPFHTDLDDVRMHMLTARLSILLDRGPTASASMK
jgi:outer membrane immunogenic protein